MIQKYVLFVDPLLLLDVDTMLTRIGPLQATNAEQIADMYRNQSFIKGNKDADNGEAEEY